MVNIPTQPCNLTKRFHLYLVHRFQMTLESIHPTLKVITPQISTTCFFFQILSYMLLLLFLHILANRVPSLYLKI